MVHVVVQPSVSQILHQHLSIYTRGQGQRVDTEGVQGSGRDGRSTVELTWVPTLHFKQLLLR